MGIKILDQIISPQGLSLSNLYCTIHAKFSIDRNGNPSGVLPDPTKAYVLRSTLHYYVDTKKPALFTEPCTIFLTEADMNITGSFYEAVYFKIEQEKKFVNTEKY